MSTVEKVKAALTEGEEPPPRPHEADEGTDLREARRQAQYFAGRHAELQALKTGPGGVHYSGPALGKSVLSALDEEIQEVGEDARTWKRAVLRLERAAMSAEEVNTLDAQAVAEGVVEEAKEALGGVEREKAEAEGGDRPEATAEEIIEADSRVIRARAHLQVGRAALDRARRAHGAARQRAIEARRERVLGEAFAALDDLETHGIPAACAQERFAAALDRLDVPEARFCGPFFGALRESTIRRFVRESRSLLRGGSVDDDGQAPAA